MISIYDFENNTVRALIKLYFVSSDPIACGSIIRLEHLTTSKNLHSHIFPSPISNKQEISAYGINGKIWKINVFIYINIKLMKIHELMYPLEL